MNLNCWLIATLSAQVQSNWVRLSISNISLLLSSNMLMSTCQKKRNLNQIWPKFFLWAIFDFYDMFPVMCACSTAHKNKVFGAVTKYNSVPNEAIQRVEDDTLKIAGSSQIQSLLNLCVSSFQFSIWHFAINCRSVWAVIYSFASFACNQMVNLFSIDIKMATCN